MADSPVLVVVGSEGRGLSRLVAETCDLTLSIPMAPAAESLNASVAAAVTLSEIARRRRLRLSLERYEGAVTGRPLAAPSSWCWV